VPALRPVIPAAPPHAPTSRRRQDHPLGVPSRRVRSSISPTTIDIDVGIFLRPDQHARVLSALATVFTIDNADEIARRIERDGQVRLYWDTTPVDLFFSYDPFHEASAMRCDWLSLPVNACQSFRPKT
jgi:hypothetical protein